MTDLPTTPFSNRCNILAELWVEYKNDTKFADFFDYNDLGLPLAYAISTEIIPSNAMTDSFVNETFDLLLEVLGISEDTGFEDLQDLLIQSVENQ